VEESPYKPPEDEEVPAPSPIGLAFRVTLALVGIVALAVAFVTRGIWLGLLTDDPRIVWVVGLAGAIVFSTWLRRPFLTRRKRVAPPRRLRNRYRR
jgi:hypothetical protein